MPPDSALGNGPFKGHDGPYEAPALAPVQTVQPGWIDYNGHMNVGYYSIAFDQSSERVWDDELGLGESLVKGLNHGPYILQSHLHYLAELRQGEPFQVALALIDADHKRAHVMLEMRKAETGQLAATAEQVMMNVDLGTRRSTPFPDWGVARLERMKAAHAALPRPLQMGQPIGLRKR